MSKNQPNPNTAKEKIQKASKLSEEEALLSEIAAMSEEEEALLSEIAAMGKEEKLPKLSEEEALLSEIAAMGEEELPELRIKRPREESVFSSRQSSSGSISDLEAPPKRLREYSPSASEESFGVPESTRSSSIESQAKREDLKFKSTIDGPFTIKLMSADGTSFPKQPSTTPSPQSAAAALSKLTSNSKGESR